MNGEAILWLIGGVLGLTFIVGVLRVICTPYNGFGDFLFRLLMLDYMGDVFVLILELLCEL